LPGSPGAVSFSAKPNDYPAKGNHNFAEISAVLADYGFVTLRLSDDWQGADFIASHIDSKQFLRVQLKGRLTIERKYCGKDIWICFQHNGMWYLYPHDARVAFAENACWGKSPSWMENGEYSWPHLSNELLTHLEQYKYKLVQ
jgi:hypothetical protein